MGQMKCPRCWKRVPEGAHFCRRCGYALAPVAPPRDWEQQPYIPPMRFPPVGLLWLLLILAAMAALFFWGVFTVGAVHYMAPLEPPAAVRVVRPERVEQFQWETPESGPRSYPRLWDQPEEFEIQPPPRRSQPIPRYLPDNRPHRYAFPPPHRPWIAPDPPPPPDADGQQ